MYRFGEAGDREPVKPTGSKYLNLDEADGANIACLVNSRHAARAAGDELRKVGGAPASFIDVGDRHGSFEKDKILEAVRQTNVDS